jgi:hypothetical protein
MSFSLVLKSGHYKFKDQLVGIFNNHGEAEEFKNYLINSEAREFSKSTFEITDLQKENCDA